MWDPFPLLFTEEQELPPHPRIVQSRKKNKAPGCHFDVWLRITKPSSLEAYVGGRWREEMRLKHNRRLGGNMLLTVALPELVPAEILGHRWLQ